MTALQVLAVVSGEGKKVSEACFNFEPFPQILKNVRLRGDKDPLANPSVQAAIRAGEETLGAKGRLVIRKSGTEPLVRVMGEGENDDAVNAVVDDICEAIEAAV